MGREPAETTGRASRRADATRRRSVGRLLFVTVLVVTTAVAATILLSFSWTARWSRDDAAGEARYQAKLAAHSVTTSLETLSTSLVASAASPLALEKVRDPAHCTLAATGLGSYPGAHVDLLTQDGSVLCSSSAPTGPSAGAGPPAWLPRTLRSAEPMVARVGRDPSTGSAAITVATRVVDGERPVAVLAAIVPVAEEGEVLAKHYAGPKHFTFTIVEPAAHVVRSASGVTDAPGTRLDRTTFGTRRSGTWKALDGRDRLFASAPVPVLGWRVYAGLDAGQVTATTATRQDVSWCSPSSLSSPSPRSLCSCTARSSVLSGR